MKTRSIGGLAFVVLMAVLSLALPGSAAAYNITFLDELPSPGVEITQSSPADVPRTLSVTGLGGTPSVFLSTPSGTFTIDITSPGGPTFREPGSANISDEFDLSVDSTGVTYTFLSDAGGTFLGTCPGCPPKTGLVQVAFLATYLDVNGATILTDTIAFQSEITETNHTPLPSSAVLLATGLLATQASTSRRRLRAQREEPRSGA